MVSMSAATSLLYWPPFEFAGGETAEALGDCLVCGSGAAATDTVANNAAASATRRKVRMKPSNVRRFYSSGRLLRAQCNHWIDARRATGRDERGDQCDDRQDKRCDAECCGIW